MSTDPQAWSSSGWEDHEIFHLEAGRRMSFRAKLQWLEEADRMVRFLAGKRRWIDKDGGVHEPEDLLAESPAPYTATGRKPESGPAGSRSDQPA
jgi:hypothetical protein